MSKSTLLFMSVFLAMACRVDHEGSEDARAWAMIFYPKATEIVAQCQQYDTNKNGYVSCSVKVDEQLIALECPSTGSDTCNENRECRVALHD